MIARLTRIAMLATAVAVLALAGCAVDSTTSIQDRIGMFIDDVNAGSYSSLYKHLHSDCVQRGAAAAGGFWDTTPFGSSHTPVSVSLSYGTTSTGTLTTDDPSTPAITFVMKEEDPDDWFILSISVGAPFAFDLN